MNTTRDAFSTFTTSIKVPKEGTSLEELSQVELTFDSGEIILVDPDNIDQIITDMNQIPSKLFKFRMVMDMQTKIVQQLEDEYNRWYAQKWIEVDSETETKQDKAGAPIIKKIDRTEGAKDKIIMTRYALEYASYQARLREERYKLSMIKSATAAIDSYSYKLHSILTYKQAIKNNYAQSE